MLVILVCLMFFASILLMFHSFLNLPLSLFMTTKHLLYIPLHLLLSQDFYCFTTYELLLSFYEKLIPIHLWARVCVCVCVCVCECRFLNAQEFSIRLRLTQFQIGSKIYLNFHGQILHNCIKEEIFDFTVFIRERGTMGWLLHWSPKF